MKSLLACASTLVLITTSCFSQQSYDTLFARVVLKTSEHPYYGKGDTMCWELNGVQGVELNFIKGRKYVFKVLSSPIRWGLTIDSTAIGGGRGEYFKGVTNAGAKEGQVMTFTPQPAAPKLLWYTDWRYTYTGWKINIQDSVTSGIATESEGGSPSVPKQTTATPNPADTKTMIRLPAVVGYLEVQLTDLLGRTVMEVPAEADPVGNVPVDLSAVRAGVYVAHVIERGTHRAWTTILTVRR